MIVRCEMCGYNATIPIGKEFGVCEACDSPVVRPTATSANDAPADGHAGNADALLRRAVLLLESSDWRKAKEVIDQALNINPENAEIYVAQLMVETRSTKEEELGNHRNQDLAEYQSYGKAIRFADADLKARLEDYRTIVLESLFRQREIQRETEEKEAAAREESAKMFKRVAVIVIPIILAIGVVFFLINNTNERQRIANLERFIDLPYVIELINEETSMAQIKDMRLGLNFITDEGRASLLLGNRVQYYDVISLHFTRTENPVLWSVRLSGIVFFDGIEISLPNIDAMTQHFSERYDVEVHRDVINLRFQIDGVSVLIMPGETAGVVDIWRPQN